MHYVRYMLCLGYNPLTLYVYRRGFARFSSTHYQVDKVDDLIWDYITWYFASRALGRVCVRVGTMVHCFVRCYPPPSPSTCLLRTFPTHGAGVFCFSGALRGQQTRTHQELTAENIEKSEMHLTNVAVQKKSDTCVPSRVRACVRA